ncbi:copper chaperone PCu(A)C [Streptomyces swartbergensis]|uniref:copper chaperone PCu(A)C n=1 Tax=Streptomyces swartbergensis TaxID=487165 RepID=UPI00380BF362
MPDTLLTALAPVAACAVALGGLTTWVSTGKAGSPPRITVTSGRVFLPYGSDRDTAAFFEIANSGDADDRPVKATSPAGSEIALSRHRATQGGAAYRADARTASIPAGGSLSMSPHGLDVTARAKAGWQDGDLVRFTLHFQHSGRIEAIAVVVRPSTSGQ